MNSYLDDNQREPTKTREKGDKVTTYLLVMITTYLLVMIKHIQKELESYMEDGLTLYLLGDLGPS